MEVIMVVAAFFIGYFIGRREPKDTVQEEIEEIVEIQKGKALASPVAGKVSFFSEGGRKGALIEPSQGTVYAPAAGKITKLYPMGNSFLLSTEQDGDLLIQVGRKQPDELCSMYYRPYIVQNEIVSKGKLLLQFDMERLKAAGEDITVMVCFEDYGESSEINVTRKEYIKVGDDMMWIHTKE